MTATTHIISDSQFNKALDKLGEFVAIPSISDTDNKGHNFLEIVKAANFAATELRQLDFDVELICIKGSAPYVVGKQAQDPKKTTVVLYAHYDVQPVDEKWNTDPFVMTKLHERLYGRGASDDKMGVIGILTALKYFKDHNLPLPVNVVVLFEGEEEIGSPHMLQFVKQEAEKVRGKALVILDGMNRDVDTGTLAASTRGLVNLAVSVNALKKPMHSGLGCLAPDPAQALTDLVHSFKDPGSIPGIRDGSIELSSEERAELRRTSISAERYARENSVLNPAMLRGNPEESIYERILTTPSISVVNMNSGERNGGNKIQASAECAIGVRLMPRQDPDHITDVMMKYLKSHPVYQNYDVKIERKASLSGWKANLKGPLTAAYLEALGENFSDTCTMPCGGGLPLIKEFGEVFPDMEFIVPAVEDPDTAAHSDNESQDIGVARKAINSLISFLFKAGATS